MSRTDDPIIEKLPSGQIEDFTCVKFKPDFSKFKMSPGFSQDLIALFKRRAYDVAASCKGVKVFLNGDELPINNLKDYAALYFKSTLDSANQSQLPAMIYEKASDRWEVVFAVSDNNFNQVSFVNSIATMNGGTHVNHVADQIIKEIMGIINKKNKSKIQIKNFQVILI